MLPAQPHPEEAALPNGNWEAATKDDSAEWKDAPDGGSEWREEDPSPKHPLSSYSMVSYDLAGLKHLQSAGPSIAAGQGTPEAGSVAELTEAADLGPAVEQPHSQAQPPCPPLVESDITTPSPAVVEDDYMRHILGLPPSGPHRAEPANADAAPHKPDAPPHESEAVTTQPAALMPGTAAISSEPAAVKVNPPAALLNSDPAAQQGTGSSAAEVATNAAGDKADEHFGASSSAQQSHREASQTAEEEPSENLGLQHALPNEGRPQGPAASSGEVTPSEHAQHGTEEEHRVGDTTRMDETSASSSQNASHGIASAAGEPGSQEHDQIKVDASDAHALADVIAEGPSEGSPSSESAAQSQPQKCEQSAEIEGPAFGAQQPGAHASTPAAATEGDHSKSSCILPDAGARPNATALQAAAAEAKLCASASAVASKLLASGSTANTTAAEAVATGSNELAGKCSANGLVSMRSQDSSSRRLTSPGSVGSECSDGEAVKDAAEGGNDASPTEAQNAEKLGAEAIAPSAEATAPSELALEGGGAGAAEQVRGMSYLLVPAVMPIALYSA